MYHRLKLLIPEGRINKLLTQLIHLSDDTPFQHTCIDLKSEFQAFLDQSNGGLLSKEEKDQRRKAIYTRILKLTDAVCNEHIQKEVLEPTPSNIERKGTIKLTFDQTVFSINHISYCRSRNRRNKSSI